MKPSCMIRLTTKSDFLLNAFMFTANAVSSRVNIDIENHRIFGITPNWKPKFTGALRAIATIWFSVLLIATASGQTPTNGNGSAVKEKTPDRLIYLPYKNLKSVFEKPDGTVLIPYGDYIKLWEKAFGDGLRKPEKPVVGGVITSANYVAKVDKDLVQISAEYVIQALDEGWIEIPVKFGESAIGKLTSDSGKVLLRGSGNGTYSFLLRTPGEHKVTIELTSRVRTAPEGRGFELEIPAVGISNFELLVPEADQTIELKPKLVSRPVDSAANESRIKASIGASEKISAWWHARLGTKPEMELLASVTNQSLVTVEDGLIHSDAWLTYEVLRGQIEKVKLVVPKDHRILDITSEAKVKEWKSVEEEGRQVVTVEMLGRVDGKMTLEVHTERATPVDSFDVAGQEAANVFGIHATDVVRESGWIAVKGGSDLTLTVEEQRGLVRIDDSEMDSRFKRPGSLYYKYYSPTFRLKLLSKPVQARMVVTNNSQLIFRDDQLKLRSTVNYTIDRAGVFELKLRLPDDLVVENVVCDRMKQFDVSSDKKILTVSLREKAQGNISLTVTCVRTLDPSSDKTDQKLPVLEPLESELENGKIQVYAPDAIDVITDAEKTIGIQPDPTPQAESVANARLVSSWIYNRRPIELPARTIRRPSRLTAFVGTRADVKQGQIQVVTNVNFQVEFAGIDTFRMAVPEAIADKVQFQSKASSSAPTIKQKSRSATAADGWVTWTIVMQRDVLGMQPFEITYDMVPGKGTDSIRETAVVEAIRILDPYDKADGPQGKRDITISRIFGEMTVVKDRALSVSANASGGDSEAIDVRELQHLSQEGFVAFRYFKQPVKLELTSNKYDIQNVVETVVSKALFEMVLDRTGVATNRCRYVLRSSERQRLRIDLPENVEIIGVLMDRKITALEKAETPSEPKWSSYFVNVARTKSSDETFSLSVIFRHAHQPIPFQNAGGTLLARMPLIGGGRSGAPVQQLVVKAWVPPEYTLVGTPKNFTVQSKSRFRELLFGSTSPEFGEQDLENWIGQGSGGVFDFPTEGKSFQYMNLGGNKQIEVAWWHVPFYTWVISGSLLVIALVLRNTTWANKITLLIVTLFAIGAYALKDQDLIVQGLQNASFGLAAAIAIWLIHGLLGRQSVQSRVEALVPAPNLPMTNPNGESPP